MAFILVYGEVSAALTAWAHYLTQEARSIHRSLDHPKESGKQLSGFIVNCKAFYITLDRFSGAIFGRHMLFVSFLLMLGMASCGYRFVSFFIGIKRHPEKLSNWGFWTMVIGYSGHSGIMAFLLVFLAMPAYEVEKQVNQLIFAMSSLAGVDCSSKEAGDVSEILERLHFFKGFSALDYFHINRSFLSSIASYFITYMIILLQFRVSE